VLLQQQQFHLADCKALEKACTNVYNHTPHGNGIILLANEIPVQCSVKEAFTQLQVSYVISWASEK
jgi:hypothetical protein